MQQAQLAKSLIGSAAGFIVAHVHHTPFCVFGTSPRDKRQCVAVIFEDVPREAAIADFVKQKTSAITPYRVS